VGLKSTSSVAKPAGLVVPLGRSLACRAAPYLLFIGLLAAGWRAWDVFHAVPSYEDVLEILWTTTWYNGALAGQHGAAVYSLAFFPAGWQVATFGSGPGIFLWLLPVSWLGGTAFAYNIGLCLAYLLAFLGARRLATRFLSDLPAVLAALLFTFWGFRWFRFVGHLNVLLAAALLPWMTYTFDRALGSRERSYRWSALTALFWALMIACSWYFVWMGGILLAGWLLGRLMSGGIRRRAAIIDMAIASGVALVLTIPLLVWFVSATNAAHVAPWTVQEINVWNASLNSLPAPAPDHPWLAPLSRWMYSGLPDESGRANFGLLATVLALAAVVPAWRDRRWRPILLITLLGLVFALGMVLTWNHVPVQWPAMRPINNLIWEIGHLLKPEMFTTAKPAPPFDTAVPLPALVVSAVVPLWERTRAFARYALLASIGLYLLAGLTLMRLRRPWLRVALACLLLAEVLPAPTGNLPFPLQAHPAFAWIAQQSLGHGEGYVDLNPAEQAGLEIPLGGLMLWESTLTGRHTVAGTASLQPAHVAFLSQWLSAHPYPFREADFAPLLRFYHVGGIVYHISNEDARDMLADARANRDVQDIRCFDPQPGPSPWGYPICVMRLAAGPANFNLLLREGWSGAESWGRWVEGTSARAEWVATDRASRRLTLEAFPACVPRRQQTVHVLANNIEVAAHQWDGCDPWTAQIEIPASAMNIGWNELSLVGDYAVRPVDIPSMQNSDPRALSLGVTRFQLDY
jgi:hypothetical protein